MKLYRDSGYLILADISGYTAYLARTEIENAQALLAELLSRILEKFNTIVEISKLEGDAVFAYSKSSPQLKGEMLMELIEATYIAFREGQELYRRTLCDCEACQSLPTLELKFLIHYGEYAIQKVGKNQEMVGSDVNLVHRLAKNHVTELTGWKGYALITKTALMNMGIPTDSAYELKEKYDHLGEITTYIFELTPNYQKWIDSRRVVVAPEDADLTVQTITDLPPYEVWDVLNDPSNRIKWEHLDSIQGSDDRPSIGRQNICLEENKVFKEILLDWKPFEYFTVERVLPIRKRDSKNIQAFTTFLLTPTENGGTNLQINSKIDSSLPDFVERKIAGYLLRYMKIEPAYKNLSSFLARTEKKKLTADQISPSDNLLVSEL